jgi:hypothetical protein
MLVRPKCAYVDAIQWRGDANQADVCAFIGISPQGEAVGKDVIYLPGGREAAVTWGMWTRS